MRPTSRSANTDAAAIDNVQPWPVVRDAGDPIAVDDELELDDVAAQRVVELGRVGRASERAAMPRVRAVLDDELLIQRAHGVAHASTASHARCLRQRTMSASSE